MKLAGQKVAVTGAGGFIGRYVCLVLENKQAKVYRIDRNILETQWSFCNYLKENTIPYVIHLAGHNGGIEFNRMYPADVFSINTQLAINVVSGCAFAGVQKLLSVITSCAYPYLVPHTSMAISPDAYLEKHLHCGPPHPSVECHGYAKRNLEIASRMYRKQYGLNAIVACPNTVYGPGDHTDPIKTKVMTGLIKKFVDAKNTNDDCVACWGTGDPIREFIYVKDTAEILLRTLEVYNEDMPLNISSGQECTIRALSELIAKKVGYEGKIVWDTSHPDGAMKKTLDVTKMKHYLGEYNFTPLEQGIEETIKWYNNLNQ